MPDSKQYTKSRELLERALKVTPLGAQTFSKSYRYFPGEETPFFLERGEGCRVWDVDGNCFVDYICALGPVTVGYHDERVDRAVIQQLAKGVSFSQPSPLAIDLAEKLTQIIPCAEMVRFVKNGSDATSAAVRLARAYTERDIILCCGYHGMQDWYIATTGNNAGIPAVLSDLTRKFVYNDLEDLKQRFREYPGQVAAIIMEPLQGDGPGEGYLEAVKDLAHENGALLIFDEVVSGFRYALGGASELYGVTPDLASYGKGMANGLPLSAVTGRRDILELIGEKAVFISTTFGGEMLSIAAAMATIGILEKPGVYETMRTLGNQLKDGLQGLIKQRNLGNVVCVSGVSPHNGLKFFNFGSLDYLDYTSIFQQKMIEEGILTYSIINLNTSHTEREIEQYLGAAAKAFDAIQKAVHADSTAGILKGRKIEPIFRRNL
jgi:glutamate-1-semialdehyde 2,1-aminomutase